MRKYEIVGTSWSNNRAENYPAQLSGGQSNELDCGACQRSKDLISDESTSVLGSKDDQTNLALLQELKQKLA